MGTEGYADCKIRRCLAFPLLDFSLSVADVDFTTNDVLSATVTEFADTLGFDAQLELKGRPGLGAFAEPFRFEIFQEFGDSNLFLDGGYRIREGQSCLWGCISDL
jgi:hypothetical protein